MPYSDREKSYLLRRKILRKGYFASGEYGPDKRSGDPSDHVVSTGTALAEAALPALTPHTPQSRLESEAYVMSSYPPPPPPPPPGHPVGARIDEAIELIEMEVRHAIAYVNDAVVPQVRSESISAMRKLSDKLRNLADKMDLQQRGPRG
jgi:hypothetical protein